MAVTFTTRPSAAPSPSALLVTKTGGNGDTDCSAAQTEAWPEPALYMHPRCCSQNMFMPPDMPTVLWGGRQNWEHIALEAVQYAIDELKAHVPIWKKEVYDGEAAAAWKENPDWAQFKKDGKYGFVSHC